ncbi:hypothetical protein TB2_043774 [Malus domestica]
MAEDQDQDSAVLEEEYAVWKKNNLFLYDLIISPSRMAVSHRPLGSLGAVAPHRPFLCRPPARSWDPHH